MGRRTPGARQRPNGRWEFRISRGSRGRTVTVSASGATMREARARAQAKLTRRIRTPEAELTLAAWMQVWLASLRDQMADGEKQPGTIAYHGSILRNHILPYPIAQIAVGDLKAQHIDDWLSALREAGVSAKRRRRCYWSLHCALERLVRRETIPSNPVRRVDPPTTPRRVRREEYPVEYARALLSASLGTRWEAYIRLALTAPLRPGELWAGEWVDLAQATEWTVARNLVPPSGEDRRWRLHDLKTRGRGIRTIPLPPEVQDALRRHRALQNQERLLAGPQWQPTDVFDAAAGATRTPDFVFTRPPRSPERRNGGWEQPGGALRKHNVQPALDRLCHDAAIPRLTPGALRSVTVSLLGSLGVQVFVIQQLAGHGSPTTTDDYVSTLATPAHEAVYSLAEALR